MMSLRNTRRITMKPLLPTSPTCEILFILGIALFMSGVILLALVIMGAQL
jgi:hypothetical protein